MERRCESHQMQSLERGDSFKIAVLHLHPHHSKICKGHLNFRHSEGEYKSNSQHSHNRHRVDSLLKYKLSNGFEISHSSTELRNEFSVLLNHSNSNFNEI
ncbi:hypothetical protein CDAR_590721 [Caerostris darwini]|uniref:Ycf2 n=1 Tax=Caerostris darwini TaxID=1538125 RepID=A0AAV4X1D6_9ARAC|nr:hypothetical protein CDAR_590721 [Caerostris darwini]